MGGNNIGQELTTSRVTWGWFEGGFDHGYVPGHGRPPTTAQICAQHHANVGGASVYDYVPHHEPFEYYASTANPMHLPPTSVAMIGRTDQANHQYDIADFWAAAAPAACRRSPTSRPRPTRTATPATPTRWTSRPGWPAR